MGGFWVYFRAYGNASRNISRLWLGATHTTQAGCKEKFSLYRSPPRQDPPEGVEHGYRSSMHDPLWSDIHIGACRHLSVLGYPQGIVALPVVWFGIIGDHHPIGHHHPWGFSRRGEESHRVS